MSEYYYKVVGKNLSSLNQGFNKVQYARNVTSYPKIGKLFVFKNIEDAESFVVLEYWYKIFKCEVTNPHGIKRISSYPSQDAIFWKQKAQKKHIDVPTMKAPKGTYVCDSVKLIEEM